MQFNNGESQKIINDGEYSDYLRKIKFKNFGNNLLSKITRIEIKISDLKKNYLKIIKNKILDNQDSLNKAEFPAFDLLNKIKKCESIDQEELFLLNFEACGFYNKFRDDLCLLLDKKYHSKTDIMKKIENCRDDIMSYRMNKKSLDN